MMHKGRSGWFSLGSSSGGRSTIGGGRDEGGLIGAEEGGLVGTLRESDIVCLCCLFVLFVLFVLFCLFVLFVLFVLFCLFVLFVLFVLLFITLKLWLGRRLARMRQQEAIDMIKCITNLISHFHIFVALHGIIQDLRHIIQTSAI